MQEESTAESSGDESADSPAVPAGSDGHGLHGTLSEDESSDSPAVPAGSDAHGLGGGVATDSESSEAGALGDYVDGDESWLGLKSFYHRNCFLNFRVG